MSLAVSGFERLLDRAIAPLVLAVTFALAASIAVVGA
jgi:hypothetical protein